MTDTTPAAIPRLIEALREISTHWATQPDHPNFIIPRYAGPYGIGLIDGHKSCKRIADRALALIEGQHEPA